MGTHRHNPQKFGELLRGAMGSLYHWKPQKKRICRRRTGAERHVFRPPGRVCFEPEPPGTFFLNANMGFIYDEIPDEPFKLAYASLLSEPALPFTDFWNGPVASHLGRCGYDLSKSAATHAVLTTGKERYRGEFIDEVNAVLNSCFSAEEALELLASDIDPLNPKA
jgi:hypothetical protein